MSMVPLRVPNAIVETGTPAVAASCAAWVIPRPRFVTPSDSNTIAAGGDVAFASASGLIVALIASSAV